MISIRDTRRYDLRSNDGWLLAPCKGKTFTTLDDRSFHAAAPKLWNDLLGSIRNTQSLNKFKKAIKTFLFAKAFQFFVSNFIFLHLLSEQFYYLFYFIFYFLVFFFSFLYLCRVEFLTFNHNAQLKIPISIIALIDNWFNHCL